MEPRFTGIDQEDEYSPETGFGWEGDRDLSVVKRPSVGFSVLRGVRYIGSEFARFPAVSYPDNDVPRE